MTPDLPRRRFTLADAMILVAALAPGLSVSSHFLRVTNFETSGDFSAINSLRIAILGLATLVPCAGGLTLAFPVLRLLPPRPPRRRRFRQPGTVSTLVAGLLIIVGGPAIAAIWNLEGGPRPETAEIVVLILPMLLASGASGARMALRMAGRRRPPEDWVDRLGRWLGWFWIASAPACFTILLD
jgi:hypothetical protein